MFDAIDFRTPAQMAKILLRRRHDPSTVRVMVINEFGRAPSVDILRAMQAEVERLRCSRDSGLSFGDNQIRYSTVEHNAAMERGSAALLRALRGARG